MPCPRDMSVSVYVRLHVTQRVIREYKTFMNKSSRKTAVNYRIIKPSRQFAVKRVNAVQRNAVYDERGNQIRITSCVYKERNDQLHDNDKSQICLSFHIHLCSISFINFAIACTSLNTLVPH